MNSTTYSPLTFRVPFKYQTKAYVNTFLEIPTMSTVEGYPWGIDGYFPYFVEND